MQTVSSTFLATIAMLCGLLASVPCFAQLSAETAQYPRRPIRMIVPFPPGGSVDLLARLISQKLSASLGQQVIVDNRAGGGGNIAAHVTAHAGPDGYTLMATISQVVTNPAVNPRADYDPVRDFTPILLFGKSPFRLVVNPKVPAATVQEWFSLVKARPGALNYGSAGSGTNMHLTVELFKLSTGVNIVHVPYKGTGPAMVDLAAGQIQMMFAGTLSAVTQTRAGRIRSLAVTSLQRRPDSPELPTIAETILPGYEAGEWFGIIGPAGMPKPLVAKINAELVRAIEHPETRDRLLADGLDLLNVAPEQFGGFLKAEFAKWRRVAKETRISVE